MAKLFSPVSGLQNPPLDRMSQLNPTSSISDVVSMNGSNKDVCPCFRPHLALCCVTAMVHE